VTLYAGGNDPMRPKVDIDALAEAYDEAVGRLRASGARRAVHQPATHCSPVSQVSGLVVGRPSR
jgi:hypothetical protein